MLEAAQEAVRLGPEEIGAYYTLWKAALLNGRHEITRMAIREALRIDPNNAWALREHADRQVAAPGVKPKQRAEVYASALARRPGLGGAAAGTGPGGVPDAARHPVARRTEPADGGRGDQFVPVRRDAPDLPLPLGRRLYVLALIGMVWAFGAWRRYRKLRAGVQLSVRSLVRRMFWARLVLVQAVLGTLCAVAIAAAPWTDRGAPQVIFWVGLAPTLLTIWFDRPRTRFKSSRSVRRVGVMDGDANHRRPCPQTAFNQRERGLDKPRTATAPEVAARGEEPPEAAITRPAPQPRRSAGEPLLRNAPGAVRGALLSFRLLEQRRRPPSVR